MSATHPIYPAPYECSQSDAYAASGESDAWGGLGLDDDEEMPVDVRAIDFSAWLSSDFIDEEPQLEDPDGMHPMDTDAQPTPIPQPNNAQPPAGPQSTPAAQRSNTHSPAVTQSAPPPQPSNAHSAANARSTAQQHRNVNSQQGAASSREGGAQSATGAHRAAAPQAGPSGSTSNHGAAAASQAGKRQHAQDSAGTNGRPGETNAMPGPSGPAPAESAAKEDTPPTWWNPEMTSFGTSLVGHLLKGLTNFTSASKGGKKHLPDDGTSTFSPNAKMTGHAGSVNPTTLGPKVSSCPPDFVIIC